MTDHPTVDEAHVHDAADLAAITPVPARGDMVTTAEPDTRPDGAPRDPTVTEVVTYLVGHAPDNEGQNPFGQDHVMDTLEELDPEMLRQVAMEAICRLANPPAMVRPALEADVTEALTVIARRFTITAEECTKWAVDATTAVIRTVERYVDSVLVDANPVRPSPDGETLARRFHATYERLAPEFGYRTREASAKPWEEVPENNRQLMTAVAAELLGFYPELAELPAPEGESSGEFLARVGTDGEKWTNEFLARVTGQYDVRERGPGTGFGWRVDVSPGSEFHAWVRTWFANAIEAGRAAGHGATLFGHDVGDGLDAERQHAAAATSIVRMLVAEGWLQVLGRSDDTFVMIGDPSEPLELDPLQADYIRSLGRD